MCIFYRASSRVSRTSRSSQKSSIQAPTPIKKAPTKPAAPANKKAANSTTTSTTTNTTTNKNRTSGTVTNTKTIPLSKAVAKNVKRKTFVASSSGMINMVLHNKYTCYIRF